MRHPALFYFPKEFQTHMSTAAQMKANQANAQKSTGPITLDGKAIASKNALKTGLTGRTVLMPNEDAELYAQHIENYRSRFKPVGPAELELVQRVADTNWRLNRIPALEAGLYAIGRAKLGDLYKDVDAEMRSMMLETEVFLAYDRQFRNLQLQESRLRSALEKDLLVLTTLQADRQRETRLRLSKTAAAYAAAVSAGKADQFVPPAFGSDFSLNQIKRALDEMEPRFVAKYQAELLDEAA